MRCSRALAGLTLIAFVAIFGGSPAQAIPIGGIEFPGGVSSFADLVVSYTPGPEVSGPYLDSSQALGVPDGTNETNFVSLGHQGTLIVQFTDNSLTTSGDATADLHIFEQGNQVEPFNVAISTDLITWIDLGDVSGQPTSIDIDGAAGVMPGTMYSYVRIIDLMPNTSLDPWGGADIDAVGAISSVPEPTTGLLLASALGVFGLARRRS